MNNLFLFYGPNAGYVLDLYERYKNDPQSVDEATRALFAQWTPDDDGAPVAAIAPRPPIETNVPPAPNPAPMPASLDVTKVVGAARLIRYIRELGHLAARIDPLGSEPPGDPGLLPEIHGVSEDDLAQLPASIVRGPCMEGSANALEAFRKLRDAYVGTMGIETDHIHNFEERSWIREAIESRQFFAAIDDTKKREVLQSLTNAETFERYLHTTFVGQKRFSLEGCDMLVPMLDSIVRNAAAVGTAEIVIGMAHRGRLNVLAHTLGKEYDLILAEFHAAKSKEGVSAAGRGSVGWAGDVKYHLGYKRAFQDSGIQAMPITLVPNPSHLEFVNPVVEGRARAAQEDRSAPGYPQQNERASLAILIHGDAAFPGQGVVAETLNMSRLKGFRTGGTIHIITNNQVGFTTDPNDSRSTLYASDLAKGFEIPVIHVNADEPESCVAAARMAHAYRETFGKDIVIDLVGYRRWGHNEGDPPAFTQPKMYDFINKHPTVRAIWAKRLEEEGVIKPGEADAMIQETTNRLNEARAKAEKVDKIDRRATPAEPGITIRAETKVAAHDLVSINNALLERPEGFAINQNIERVLERRRTAMEQDNSIDWGHAETLAFATILADGTPIRLTGQDSERGTFVQRHLVLHDGKTGQEYVPLHAIPQAHASFAVYNSPLSEIGVLGFEYGYSSHVPNALVLWEGQFGDFANGAQVIIDQFLVSGRAKWQQNPSLVLLLPHGYEGQGPEHSSARLERFLQLAAEDNIRVANCTTSAQYFHLLRRQAKVLESDPRPLIIMTPKSLLRHPSAASSLKDLAEGRFMRVIDDATAQDHREDVTRLIFCTGKVFVDVVNSPDYKDLKDVALVRIEELYSFPKDEVTEILGSYPNVADVVWLQEEPRNMGAWSYIEPRLRELIPAEIPLLYAGRAPSATTAEGSLSEHVVEQAAIIKDALGAESRKPVAVTVSTQQDG